MEERYMLQERITKIETQISSISESLNELKSNSSELYGLIRQYLSESIERQVAVARLQEGYKSLERELDALRKLHDQDKKLDNERIDSLKKQIYIISIIIASSGVGLGALLKVAGV